MKLYPGQYCAVSLILNLLVRQKGQRETSLPRLSTERLVPPFTNIGINSDLGDFFDDKNTPSFTPYEDDEGIEAPTMLEADVIADNDRYIESEVLLPRNGM